MADLTYEQGYSDGESNAQADYQAAFDGLVPDEVAGAPLALAEWVQDAHEKGYIAGQVALAAELRSIAVRIDHLAKAVDGG